MVCNKRLALAKERGILVDPQPLTLTRIVMDEVEFARAYNNLRVLITAIDQPDQLSITNIRNALLTIAAMMDGLHQRITEMQLEEDDE